MKPVLLVFHARSTWRARLFGNARHRVSVPVFAIMAATAVAGAVGWRALTTFQQAHGLREAAESIRTRAGLTSREAAAHRPPLTASQIHAWNAVTGPLNVPWPALLEALETSLSDDVALVSAEPEPGRSVIRLQVEAKSLGALLSYAQSLKSAVEFSDVVLLKHETNDQDATHPLRLTLELQVRVPRSLASGAP